MKKLAIFLLALPLCIFAQANRGIRPVEPAASSRRVALIVGNNDYHNQQPLRNSVNDAVSMGDALRGLGFEVDVERNVSMPQFEEAADKFIASVRPGDVALFYYSGHGMQIGEENYLIPIDFDARTPADAKYKAYAASRMQDNLRDAGANLQILILDACRDNPYRGLRGGGGLGAMQAAKGAYIALATAPGRTADDNAAGNNGLFTGALLGALKQPGLTLDQVFNRVRADVSGTRPTQVPWSTSSVVNEFYFRTPVATPEPVVARAETPRQVQTAERRAGDTTVNAKDGLSYAWIPPGTFMMGCSPGDNECDESEKPAHRVNVTHGFWLGVTPVTQAAYRRVAGTNPSSLRRDDHPVETVSWDEADRFCSQIGGRLPTEAEWEYAARAGTTGPTYAELGDIAWYSANSGQQTHEVGKKKANAWGLADMLGNVVEWTTDWFEREYYGRSPADDPLGGSDGVQRILRGGAWGSEARNVRASFRGAMEPDMRRSGVGFRCVAELN
jgi:formylglycine-generating enzyme required for sulfatase activity